MLRSPRQHVRLNDIVVIPLTGCCWWQRLLFSRNATLREPWCGAIPKWKQRLLKNCRRVEHKEWCSLSPKKCHSAVTNYGFCFAPVSYLVAGDGEKKNNARLAVHEAKMTTNPQECPIELQATQMCCNSPTAWSQALNRLSPKPHTLKPYALSLNPTPPKPKAKVHAQGLAKHRTGGRASSAAVLALGGRVAAGGWAETDNG